MPNNFFFAINFFSQLSPPLLLSHWIERQPDLVRLGTLLQSSHRCALSKLVVKSCSCGMIMIVHSPDGPSLYHIHTFPVMTLSCSVGMAKHRS